MEFIHSWFELAVTKKFRKCSHLKSKIFQYRKNSRTFNKDIIVNKTTQTNFKMNALGQRERFSIVLHREQHNFVTVQDSCWSKREYKIHHSQLIPKKTERYISTAHDLDALALEYYRTRTNLVQNSSGGPVW